ncbi:MAG: cell division protein FtsQ/DivIB [Gammaproteobacteria bacterium]
MSQAVIREPVRRDLPSPMALAFVLMLGTTLVLVSWAVSALSDPAALPIRRVMVEGEFTHLDPEVLEAAVVDAVDAGFFQVNVAEIRARLQDEPWIRRASIRRVWPDSLHVSVVEQTPTTRWGEQALLNEIGDIFAPPPMEIPPGLVSLDGPLGTEVEVLETYRYLRDALAPSGIGIAAVALSARHAWTVTTSDGKLLVLGRKDLAPRVERFLFGYARGLDQLWPRIGRVDLRYTNGFAASEAAATGDRG